MKREIKDILNQIEQYNDLFANPKIVAVLLTGGRCSGVFYAIKVPNLTFFMFQESFMP